MLLAGGWWIAIVELWPASSRPYIGGSQNNSILELTLGYNGLGRLSGNETGSVGGGGRRRRLGRDRRPAAVQQRDRRPDRLAAPGGARAGRWPRCGSPAVRPNLRAGLVLWVTWLLVTALTFSFMAGIFHAYYTVALAPAVAALVGIGAWVLWQHRGSLRRHGCPVVHGRHDLGARVVPARPHHGLRAVAEVGASSSSGLVAALALAGVGPPAAQGRAGRGGDGARGRRWPARRRTPSAPRPRRTPARSRAPARPPAARRTGRRTGGRRRPRRALRAAPGRRTGGCAGPAAEAPAAGGMGGLLNGSTSSAEVTALLQTDADAYTWAAAAVGRQQRGRLPARQRAAGDGDRRLQRQRPEPDARAVPAVRRRRPDPLVHRQRRRRAVGPAAAAATRSPSGSMANFTATTVDGMTLYDLSGGIQ